MALVRLWWETFVGILRTAPGEHWEMLRQDGVYAIKTMSKRPGFAAVAVLTLALGIGANVSIFSLVNGVLLEPLPFPAPDRLVQIFEQNQTEGIGQAASRSRTFSIGDLKIACSMTWLCLNGRA